MDQESAPPALWKPDETFRLSTQMQAYVDGLKTRTGKPFADYQALWEWSVRNLEDFWASIWEFFQVHSHTPYQAVLQRTGSDFIGTKWFEGAQVNYAEHIFRARNDAHPAIIFQSERHALQNISWEDLAQQVAALSHYLRQQGVGKGDRVVSYMPNIPQTVVAFLATSAIGAVWSSCSPDFGTPSVVDRFQQIEPKVLFAVDGYSYQGKSHDRQAEVRQLIAALPSLSQVIFLPYLSDQARPQGFEACLWPDALAMPGAELHFEPVPFDHPLWVLYSSGTTGKPKAITHSVGGNLIEHLKALGLHHDCQPGDRLFWYSTTGWMMWNFAVAAMLHGTTMVIYDGSASYPNLHRLWDFAQAAQVNHFGSGAAFYIACMNAGLSFDTDAFPALRSIGSTGSPLPPEAFHWIYSHVKSSVWLASISGGTDVCSGFVGGSPFLPVYAGEIQCRMLGCKVEAFNEAGMPVLEAVGEMVITAPMPSMPLYFWGDEENLRYRASYFDMYPGLWRHGDWIKITERGSVIIYGRSDATLNRGGVRIGTSEVYQAVNQVPEIADSLVISLERKDGTYYMPLFVVLTAGARLSNELKQTIKQALRSQFSPRHVPDDILEVPAVPYTMSGKKMETPIKRILMGQGVAKAASKDAMRNPEALQFFVQFAQQLNLSNT